MSDLSIDNDIMSESMSINNNNNNNNNVIDMNIDNIPRLYKPKSNVWKYYISDFDKNGKSIMKCCFCLISFSHYTSKNATKLRQHLLLRCLTIPNNIKQQFINQMPKHSIQIREEMVENEFIEENNVKAIRPKRHNITNGSSVKLVVKEKKVPVVEHVQQVSKYKKLKEDNIKLNSRLRISLKQNEALINITRNLTKCLELMRKLDFLKSNDKQLNESEIDDLNSEIGISEELANDWKLKYENINFNTDIEVKQNDKNDIFNTSGNNHNHKPQSSIWKYYKLVDKKSSDGYKTIKCIFCDKTFRQKVLNAYKCRTHIVEKCDKCPEDVREEEDIMVVPHSKSKVAIWEHFIINEEEGRDGKASTQCSYCGLTYSGKNATKCREHLVAKCEQIPNQIKQLICSQCDQDFIRNLQQPIKSKISIWEHYDISEEEGRISCRCIYCGTVYAHKNATKCREHLVDRCDKIPSEIRSDISNQCEETPSRTWTQSKIPIWEHYVITEEDGKMTVECNYCGITYASKNATKCRLHLILKCDKIPFDIKERISNESGDAYLNVLKNNNPKKMNYMVRKRKLYERCALGKAGRPKCQIWQYFSDQLDSEGKTIRQCIYCETTFGFRTSRNATKLRDHLAINCKTAPQNIKNSVDLEDGFVRTVKDYRDREVERRYQCCWPGCELAFPKRSRLLKHQLVHTGNIIRIKCDWPGCDWTGRDRFSVKMHKYIHTGEKPWSCDWPGCDFKTAKPSSLYIHKLRHNNLRRFKCEWPGCERAFLTNSQRKVHKMVHLGIKPYACQSCDKRFPAPNKLKLHQNKHHSNEETVS